MATKQNLSINAFLIDTLGLSLTNRAWSWHAYEAETGTVVMKLWQDLRFSNPDRIEVFAPPPYKSPSTQGRYERRQNVNRLISGEETFAVIRERIGQEDGETKAYTPLLYRLGTVTKDEHGFEHAAILETLTPYEFVSRRSKSESSEEKDISEIIAKHSGNPTTCKTLINARRGQGKYRMDLLERWDGGCAVTGCTLGLVLRASHAKPWRICNDDERLDPDNGLPLIANLDLLFDAYLIGWDAAGHLVTSPALPAKYHELLGLRPRLLKAPSPAQAKYLEEHLVELRRKYLNNSDTSSSR